ncbi:uncharacterized protein LOC143299153 [Babylonia areolata]|uniref:uncharacterized protein LOC143299153 n=1 Tax=Babylonia areolata TaxID=304850 RepID=UPI003FD4D00C
MPTPPPTSQKCPHANLDPLKRRHQAERLPTDKTLTQLTQQVRHRTTSEHLLGMRYQEKSGGFKSENQVAKENLCHMDYMPVPEGPWGENFRARNMKWTTMLIFASSALGITIYCMCVMNIFYLHTLPSRRRILPDVEKIGKIRPIECDEDDEEEM